MACFHAPHRFSPNRSLTAGLAVKPTSQCLRAGLLVFKCNKHPLHISSNHYFSSIGNFMEFLTAYNLIDLLVVFLLTLFSLFLLGLKSDHRTSLRLLAAFLLVVALSYLDSVFSFQFQQQYANFANLTTSFDYLVGPCLWLYVLSRIDNGFKLKPIYFATFIPFLAHFGILLTRYHFKPIEIKRLMLRYGAMFTREEKYMWIFVNNLQYALYLGVVIYLLWAYQKSIKQQYSNLFKKNLNWLLFISSGLLVGVMMRSIDAVLWMEVPRSTFLKYIDLKLFGILAALTFACMVVYKSLQQPEILRMSSPQQDAETATNSDKYQTTKIPIKLRVEYINKLQNHMQNQKPYLDADLNLKDLALNLNIPSHHLSQAINVEMDKNFYEYVNDYRLEECINLLKNPDYSAHYITQIMYDSGFNSKSVFNPLFKKKFGLTPREYRQNI